MPNGSPVAATARRPEDEADVVVDVRLVDLAGDQPERRRPAGRRRPGSPAARADEALTPGPSPAHRESGRSVRLDGCLPLSHGRDVGGADVRAAQRRGSGGEGTHAGGSRFVSARQIVPARRRARISVRLVIAAASPAQSTTLIGPDDSSSSAALAGPSAPVPGRLGPRRGYRTVPGQDGVQQRPGAEDHPQEVEPGHQEQEDAERLVRREAGAEEVQVEREDLGERHEQDARQHCALPDVPDPDAARSGRRGTAPGTSGSPRAARPPSRPRMRRRGRRTAAPLRRARRASRSGWCSPPRPRSARRTRPSSGTRPGAAG